MSKKKNVDEFTVQEHLSELKRRIFTVVIIELVLFLVCLLKSRDFLVLFLNWGREAGYTIVALSPQETLLQQLRVCFICGFVMSVPILLYEVIVFVNPAFDKGWRRKCFVLIFFSLLLFIVGVIFFLKALFPFVLKYMYDVSSASGVLMEISVENYISFFLTLMICMGLVFEIPMVSVILLKFGVVTSRSLKRHQGIVIVVIFILAAIITPPDVVSQLIVAVPMILLYEISILLCMMIEKRSKVSEDSGEGEAVNG